jgi:hypothetical protein
VVPILNKVKGLMRIFSHSVLLVNELMNIQEKHGMRRRKPIKANATRWNSSYDMLEYAIENILPIQAFDINCSEVLSRAQLPAGTRYGDCILSSDDWDAICMLVCSI